MSTSVDTAARSKIERRVKSRKYMGDDSGSWAVFLDGRPVVTGLNKSQVPYYKRQIVDRLMEQRT